MLIWSIVLFILGIVAVLDAQFNYSEIFRRANSLVFMFLSLGVLVRTKILINRGFRERLIRENIKLEAKVKELENVVIPLKNELIELESQNKGLISQLDTGD